MSLEGWSGFMYLYLDSAGYVAFAYFPVLVVVGNFFLLKLFLAVIMTAFDEMSEIQADKIEQYDEQVIKNQQNSPPNLVESVKIDTAKIMA